MSECTIKTIFDKLVGKATSYIVNKDKTEIFVPARRFTKAGAYKIAERMHNKAIKEFGAFGKNTSLNTTYTDGTAVNIHPTKMLDDAYAVKEGNKNVKEISLANDIRISTREAADSVYERETKLGIDQFGDSDTNMQYQTPFVDEQDENDVHPEEEITSESENLVDPELNNKFEQMLEKGILTQICN